MSTASSIPGASNGTMTVHQLFRGAAELTKYLHRAALGLEIIAALIASWGALGAGTLWGGWASLVMLLLMVAATSLRIWSSGTHGFSERCRRVSSKSFAVDERVSWVVLSGLVSDAPAFAERIASKLPTSSLEEYYEPTQSLGMPRLQEIYAHNAFYSWRLLRRGGWLFLITGCVVAIAGAVIIYGLALPSTEISSAGRILDVVCSLVFVVLAAKSFVATAVSFVACREARSVADGLITTLDRDRVDELIAHYDIERASGPSIPTFVYKASRNELQVQWHQRRKALDEMK